MDNDKLDISWLRNVANIGRGSSMTAALHTAADAVESLRAENERMRAEIEHWKYLYECAQNANSHRQDAIDKLGL